jgi:hypothetical protein
VVQVKVAEAEAKLRNGHAQALEAVRKEAQILIDKAMMEKDEYLAMYTKVCYYDILYLSDVQLRCVIARWIHSLGIEAT